MSYTATLELVTSNGHNAKGQSLPELPVGLEADLEKANLVLNHGLLIGEMLGIPIHKAQRIIDHAYNQADSEPYFDIAEQQWLLITFSAIQKVLCHAINTDGTPAQNTFGKALEKSDLLESNQDGGLLIKHRRLHLYDLQRKLYELNNFLSFAIGNDLMIKMQ